MADMDEQNLIKEAELIRKNGNHVEIFCGDLRKNLTIKKKTTEVTVTLPPPPQRYRSKPPE